MSVDERVREALRRSLDGTDAGDLAGPLGYVEERGVRARRHRHIRNAGLATIAIVALAVTTPALLRSLRTDRVPVVPPTPSVDPYAQIAGTYTTTLPAGSDQANRSGTIGPWIITLQTDGSMSLIPPSSFASAPVYSTYALQGDTFTTDAFTGAGCSGPDGEYRWQRNGPQLVLTPIRDHCDARDAVFGFAPLSERAPSAIDGTWTTHTVTAARQVAEIRSAGFSRDEARAFLADQGETTSIVYSVRFGDGVFTTFGAPDGAPQSSVDTGSYAVDGDRITIRPFSGGSTVWRFTLEGDRLDLTLVRDTQPPYKAMSDEVFQHGIYTTAPFFRSS